MAKVSWPVARAEVAPLLRRPPPLAAGVGLDSLVVLAALLAADGAYFPSAWNAGAIAVLWVAALALFARSVPRPGWRELSMLGALAALTAWIGASAAWSIDPAGSLLELQRAVVYLGAVLALLLVVRPAHVPHLLGGAVGAVAAVSAYGLATRLFPERSEAFDPVAGYRLFEPLGYWSALGIVAAMGPCWRWASSPAGRRSEAASSPGRVSRCS